MIILSLILSFCLFLLGCSNPLDEPSCGKRTYDLPNDDQIHSMIVGGRNASEGEFPWQVSIRAKSSLGDFSHICGGSILSSNTIVTAGHCVKNDLIKQVNFNNLN